jgi:hypothetical protein
MASSEFVLLLHLLTYLSPQESQISIVRHHQLETSIIKWLTIQRCPHPFLPLLPIPALGASLLHVCICAFPRRILNSRSSVSLNFISTFYFPAPDFHPTVLLQIALRNLRRSVGKLSETYQQKLLNPSELRHFDFLLHFAFRKEHRSCFI